MASSCNVTSTFSELPKATSLVFIPNILKTSVFPLEGTVTLNFPSDFAKAPDVVPFTIIVAPGKGAPLEFVTLPETTLS